MTYFEIASLKEGNHLLSMMQDGVTNVEERMFDEMAAEIAANR